MKVITGNALRDGRVIYLGADDQWQDRLCDARIFDDHEAEAALLSALARSCEIAGAYLIEVSGDKNVTGRQALYETIRSQGPSIDATPPAYNRRVPTKGDISDERIHPLW